MSKEEQIARAHDKKEIEKEIFSILDEQDLLAEDIQKLQVKMKNLEDRKANLIKARTLIVKEERKVPDSI